MESRINIVLSVKGKRETHCFIQINTYQLKVSPSSIEYDFIVLDVLPDEIPFDFTTCTGNFDVWIKPTGGWQIDFFRPSLMETLMR